MAKVTSKLQVTIPKVLAEQHGIQPGSELAWQSAGDAIRLVPGGVKRAGFSREARLDLFDHATERQKKRQRGMARDRKAGSPRGRGWTREALYDRGRPR